jgi:kynureninase
VVEGHSKSPDPWTDSESACSTLFKDIIGANYEHEICSMSELCVDIHLLLAAFYNPVGKKSKILMEEGAFPSDRVNLLIIIVCCRIIFEK